MIYLFILIFVEVEEDALGLSFFAHIAIVEIYVYWVPSFYSNSNYF